MIIGILKEAFPKETRVAATPQTTSAFKKAGLTFGSSSLQESMPVLMTLSSNKQAPKSKKTKKKS